MLPRRWALYGLVLVAAVAGATGGESPSVLPADRTQLDPDRTLVEVEVRPDGAAVWRVEYRVTFDDGDNRETFAAVREEVDGNLSYAGAFAEDMRRSVAAAESETDRGMAIRNVTVEAVTGRIPEEHGKVVYTFIWDGFAAVQGERVRVGDTLPGLYLDADTTLLVTWAEGLRLADARPEPAERREGELVWTGPEEFGSDGPRVVLERSAAGDGAARPVPDLAIIAGAALVGVALLTVVVRRRRRAAPDAGGDGAGDAAVADEPPEELLSDEERVLARLDELGGRMKQQDLVAEMGWSETKTSEVVGRLQDDDRVEVYRIGRENVLALPGEMDV